MGRIHVFGSVKQIQQMQQRIMQAQEELGRRTVEATAGGGAVTIVMDGHQKVHSVKIAPEAVDPADLGMLEDLILAAVNEGVDKTQSMAAQQLNALTGGIKIPGLGL
jgi:DNA-binding YbaB/EbfC family protein